MIGPRISLSAFAGFGRHFNSVYLILPICIGRFRFFRGCLRGMCVAGRICPKDVETKKRMEIQNELISITLNINT